MGVYTQNEHARIRHYTGPIDVIQNVLEDISEIISAL